MVDSEEAWEWLERISTWLGVDTEELIELEDRDFWYVYRSYHKKNPNYMQKRALDYWRKVFS